MTASNEVLERIDSDEIADLAVELGNIYAPTGHENPIGEYLIEWLEENEFDDVEKIGITEDRYSVVARIPGDGSGYDLAFNAHMDAIMSKDDVWMYRDAEQDVFHKAWVENGRVYGVPVVNDRGPMTSFLIAAKALKESDVKMKGDVILTMVPGEIEAEPIDEYQGLEYHAQDIGARYMINHGVIPDYAVVAEATNNKLGWIEAGKAYFKITVYSDLSLYTPYVEYPEDMTEAPNAILRASSFLKSLVDWSRDYSEENTKEYSGGTVVPKVSIGAIRGGNPNKVYRTPELCSLYVDVRLTPDGDPRDIKRDLDKLADQTGVEVDINPYAYRRGFEAQNVEPLTNAMEEAHHSVFGDIPEQPDPPENSMWRDINPFNQMNIPAVNYGPGSGAGEGTLYIHKDEMKEAAEVYALAALDICNREA